MQVRLLSPAPEEVINLLNKEKKTKELLSDIAKLEKKYEDKIAVVIVSALRKSEKTIEESDLIAIWDEAEDKIIDLIYELLERVYRLILEFIKEVYPEAKISKRIDIKSLTWQEDGKTIEDRVKLYCDYAHEVLKTDKNISDLRDRLIHNFIRIVETEDIVVLNQVLKRRVADYYPYVQISNGSCECCGSVEIERVENVSEWPPRHPMCGCVAILLTEEEYKKFKE